MGRLGLRTLAGTAALLATLPLPAQEQQPPVYRVEVKLVRLLATVKDQNSQLVGSLGRNDFTVFDDGVKQEIGVFERHTEQPLSVSLLVDTSGSTAKDLKYELDSVSKFLKALFSEGNPEDAVSLYSFDSDVTVHNSFTHRMAALEGNLRRLKAEGGTALYDALYLASERLEDREGRHVIVVVTDGGDTVSAKNYHQALEAAQRADTVIYAILVMPITNDAGRNIGGENALATLTASTGGKVFMPSVGATLDAAFAEILSDLRTQYLIGYYPRNVPFTKDRFHRVEVKLSRPDLRAITRNGYYGDREQSTGGGRRPARARDP